MSDMGPVILITVLSLVVATGIIMLVLVYQKKQLQYLNEKEQMKATYEREILESKLEMQEQTMKNISEEIHDNIGQLLSVIKLNLNLINSNDTPQLLEQKITNTSLLVSEVIKDLRNLSKSLNTDIIAEKGLIKSIEYEFETLRKMQVYSTSLRIDGEVYRLPAQEELILFRIFQEILNNVIKHANASAVEVCIHFKPDTFFLEMNDNGCGFNVDGCESSGLGIRNMKNRSQLIGATYNINSETGKGTCIKIELPVTAKTA